MENLPLEQLIFIIPVWHCYAHLRPICQSIMSSRCVKGNGLIDGEVMERHWSELAEYSKSTKESRPENRHDALTHGVYFIRRTLVNQMGKRKFQLRLL